MNRKLSIAAFALSLLWLPALGTGCLADGTGEPIGDDLSELSAGRAGNSPDTNLQAGSNDDDGLPLETSSPFRDPCVSCGPGPQPWQAKVLSARPGD